MPKITVLAKKNKAVHVHPPHLWWWPQKHSFFLFSTKFIYSLPNNLPLLLSLNCLDLWEFPGAWTTKQEWISSVSDKYFCYALFALKFLHMTSTENLSPKFHKILFIGCILYNDFQNVCLFICLAGIQVKSFG